MFELELKIGWISLRKAWIKELLGFLPHYVRTCVMYGSKCSHQNLMDPFLYETIHLGISIHINYKVIGLVLSEL